MQLLARILGATVAPIRTAIFWLSQMIPGVKRLAQISLAARIALLTFVFLALISLAFFLANNFLKTGIAREQYNTWPNILIVSALVIVIPFPVYFFVRLLMQGDVSRFPDIDRDWKLGLEALANQGISINETPIFVVLGSPTHEFSSNLMNASRIGFNVKEVPNGPASLHWFANQDGIFLFCTDTCCLSKLTTMVDSIAAAGPSPSSAQAVPQGTMLAGGGGGAAGPGQTMVGGMSAPASPGPSPNQTMVGGPGASPAPSAPAPAAAAPPTPRGVGMGTIQIDTERGVGEFIQSIDQAVVAQKPVLNPRDVSEQNARLEYVCRLLQKARQPVCPMNGILTLLSFRLVECAPDQVQAAAQRDLAILRKKLKLRCPVTILVTEMDREPGFRELVRRVGVDRAKQNRFGKGFNVWNAPTDEQLEAVARHACGAFEDWTYMLFKEHDGLRKPGNTKLFGLLCKIRGSFTDALANVLADGFGYRPDRDPELANRQFPFSGCYFAATGQTEDRQAFVQSAIVKVMDQEGELDWTDEALKEDDRFQFGANLFALLGIASILAIAALLTQQWWIDKVPFLNNDSAEADS